MKSNSEGRHGVCGCWCRQDPPRIEPQRVCRESYFSVTPGESLRGLSQPDTVAKIKVVALFSFRLKEPRLFLSFHSAMPDTIQVTVTGTQPPPPSGGGTPLGSGRLQKINVVSKDEPTTIIGPIHASALPTDSCLDLSLCQHKVLGVGNLLCGLGLVIANVIAVVTSLATLQLLTLVVRGAIALGGVLLATAALCMLPSLVRYISDVFKYDL